MKITSFKQLVNQINKDLGDFCGTFARKRKELADLRKSPRRDILFKYDNEDRDWAINEGGGTEIQYHIYLRDNVIGYGLGFNMQYVPFANDRAPVDWIKPFCDAFLELYNKNEDTWNFEWIYGDIELLKRPQNGEYVLYGKEITLDDQEIDDIDYSNLLVDLRGVMFDIYKQVFEMKNNKQDSRSRVEDMIKKYSNLLLEKHNIILQGAPGTGKTYNTAAIALATLGIKDVDFSDHKAVMERYESLQDSQIFFTTFHQSLDYEDFVEGLKPRIQTDNNGNSIGVTYEPEDGIFKRACQAVQNDDSKDIIECIDDYLQKIKGFENKEVKPVVLIIDEINRGNVSKIFGELITLLEADKRDNGTHPIKVLLPYSKTLFGVPSNLYIIGTMNTTDRSTGTLDYALRRRFAFVTLKSNESVISKYYDDLGDAELKDVAISLFNDIRNFILDPKHLCGELGVDDLMVGHSYFMSKSREELASKIEFEVIPLINEYINDGLINVKSSEKEIAFASWMNLTTIEDQNMVLEGNDFEEK